MILELLILISLIVIILMLLFVFYMLVNYGKRINILEDINIEGEDIMKRTELMQEVENYVIEAAKAFDVLFPNWHNLIDTEILDMMSVIHCLGGQISTLYNLSRNPNYMVTANEIKRYVDDYSKSEYEFGLDLHPNIDYDAEIFWLNLQAIWVRQIEERRSSNDTV